MKSVWTRIRQIKVKESSNSIHHLSVNCDIANTLADTFSHNSSSLFSTDAFTYVRCKAEKQTINLSDENAEVYNRPLSLEVLHNALCRAHDNSAGPDEITLSPIEAST